MINSDSFFCGSLGDTPIELSGNFVSFVSQILGDSYFAVLFQNCLLLLMLGVLCFIAFRIR